MAVVTDFSNLPAEALDEIARRAGALDNVICSAVCKPWRQALYATRLRGLEQPSQVHRVYLHSDCYGCCMPNPNPKEWTSRKVSVSHISPIGHRERKSAVTTVLDYKGGLACPSRVIGYSCNWVVVVDEACGLSLLEPLTGRRFPLPPITSSRGCSKKLQKELEQMGKWMVHKAALAPGRRLGTYAVMLIHSDGHGLSFLASGTKSWTTVGTPTWKPKKYVDVILHKGAFYTVSIDTQLNAWVLDGSSTGVRSILAAGPQKELAYSVKLHESRTRDDLLMEGTTKNGLWDQTSKVWRYHEDEGKWTEVTNERLGRFKSSFGISRRGLHTSC